MEVVNCPRCGKVFARIKGPLCPECEREEEKEFDTVKEYINEHANCTLSELSEGTGVTPKKILRYIREGRLEASHGMQGEIRCEMCHKPITHGRFCDACLIKINRELGQLQTKTSKPKEAGPRMHITED